MAAGAVSIAAMLSSNVAGCGRLMDVSWDSWLLKDAREKEYIDSVRLRPTGLKYESTLPDPMDGARGESFGGGGGGTWSEGDDASASCCSCVLFLRYFSRSVWSEGDSCVVPWDTPAIAPTVVCTPSSVDIVSSFQSLDVVLDSDDSSRSTDSGSESCSVRSSSPALFQEAGSCLLNPPLHALPLLFTLIERSWCWLSSSCS